MKKLQEFWHQHREQIIPGLVLIKRCLSSIVEMREKPNLADYLNLGFSIHDNFEVAYSLKDPYCYFNNSKWKFITSNSLGGIICNLIQNSLAKIIPVSASGEAATAFVTEIEGIKFGWILYENQIDRLYVEKSAEKHYTRVLEKIFWEQYPFHHVILGMDPEEPGDKRLYVQEDEESLEFIPTVLAQTETNYIQEYLDHGFSRSIIYYGPPGSGKSNLVKNICYLLKVRTIRINDISQLSINTIGDIIRIFNPHAIVLEDIDNISARELSQLLHKIESVNKKHKLLLATANKLYRLNNAMIRPERFDEIRRIFQLEEEIALDLVNKDKELYDLIKDWPAASIVELMKRVTVKGKSYALDHMQDLVDRVNKINTTNYELQNSAEEDDDEEETEVEENGSGEYQTPSFTRRILLNRLKE